MAQEKAVVSTEDRTGCAEYQNYKNTETTGNGQKCDSP